MTESSAQKLLYVAAAILAMIVMAMLVIGVLHYNRHALCSTPQTNSTLCLYQFKL